MGDILRAFREQRQEIAIRHKFTKVAPGEYLKALRIFQSVDTIRAIPVVNSDGFLLGEYSAWNDSIVLSCKGVRENSLLNGEFATDFWLKHPIIGMIKPLSEFNWKMEQFNLWEKYLTEKGATIEIINDVDCFDFSKYNASLDYYSCVLVVDDDERRTVRARFSVNKRNDVYVSMFTYKEFEEGDVFKKQIGIKHIRNCLHTLQEQGVHILTVSCNKDNPYYSILSNSVRKKYYDIGKIPTCGVQPEFYSSFYGELYTPEYANEIARLDFKTEKINDTTYRLKNCQSKYLNVENHQRVTAGQPKDFAQEIFFYGPCLIYGHFVEDKNTIESFLQAILNSQSIPCRVVNLGAPGGYEISHISRLEETQIHKGDIVVIFLESGPVEGIQDLDLVSVLKNNNVPAEWMTNGVFHVNHKINKLYADAIHDKIKNSYIKKQVYHKDRELLKLDNSISVEAYIDSYCLDFNKIKGERIGAIVMNCNPFTLGHRYLIEEALKSVDFLVIFVVEEDRSLFPFDIRFSLVKMGTSDLDNVVVVPSGNYILSENTFPEYFIKIADEDIVKNVEYDVTLFAEQIAPRLNIVCRFVGEEPDDNVTREYNEAMKRILPANGIELIEIPRLKLENGQIISATAVRQCLENNDMEMLDHLIPESTKKILFWENR